MGVRVTTSPKLELLDLLAPHCDINYQEAVTIKLINTTLIHSDQLIRYM
jgi:hypothetical protein